MNMESTPAVMMKTAGVLFIYIMMGLGNSTAEFMRISLVSC